MGVHVILNLANHQYSVSEKPSCRLPLSSIVSHVKNIAERVFKKTACGGPQPLFRGCLVLATGESAQMRGFAAGVGAKADVGGPPFRQPRPN